MGKKPNNRNPKIRKRFAKIFTSAMHGALMMVEDFRATFQEFPSLIAGTPV
jgi:hypothetical protein